MLCPVSHEQAAMPSTVPSTEGPVPSPEGCVFPVWEGCREVGEERSLGRHTSGCASVAMPGSAGLFVEKKCFFLFYPSLLILF